MPLIWLKKTLNHWLPQTCVLCHCYHANPIALCNECEASLPWLLHSCPHCGAHQSLMAEDTACGNCLLEAPPYERTLCPLSYDSTVGKFIYQLKFNHNLLYARLFAQLLSRRVQRHYHTDLPEAIIPVPLHRSRLRKRGYNQALEIGRYLSKHLAVPLDYQHCWRTKQTKAQAQLGFKARQGNVSRAFCTRSMPYQHVAVLDDVVTTGNTVKAFCQTLQKAGVKRIDVWCCARPPFD